MDLQPAEDKQKGELFALPVDDEEIAEGQVEHEAVPLFGRAEEAE